MKTILITCLLAFAGCGWSDSTNTSYSCECAFLCNGESESETRNECEPDEDSAIIASNRACVQSVEDRGCESFGCNCACTVSDRACP